jgi:hypothetical protein
MPLLISQIVWYPMSSIAKKFFVASLVYLILGLLGQAIAIFDVWLGFNRLAYTAVATTEQILLAGWLTQLAVTLIYDRWRAPAELPAGDPSVQAGIADHSTSMIVFWLFNLGLPLVIIGQPGLALFGGRWLGPVAAFGGLLQLLAGLVFVREIWRCFKSQ